MASKRLDLYNVVRIKKSHMQRRMTAMAKILEREWKSMASASLKTTLVTYRNNIVVEATTDAKLVIVLRGMVANMVEQGLGPGGVGSFGPFDVRKFVLSGRSNNPNIKSGKKGLYVNIPFEQTLGMISGLSYNVRGKRAASAVKTLAGISSKRLSDGTYQIFNASSGAPGIPKGTLEVGAPLSGKKRAAMDAALGGPPGRLGAGYGPNMRPSRTFLTDPMGNQVAQEAHATDPLAGMVRFSHTYTSGSGRTSTSGLYGTWRRISQGGKPWMHPGIKPRKFAEKLDTGAAMVTAFMDLV